ncbi:hypothetical protein [Paenibacillus lactis]|uniref:hypothetical protein n=1 Tax=Paenibacillus lactis TaxID=228574 RepID=UPI0036BF5249
MKRLLAAIGKYSIVPLCICLFGLFIYPTMYKYDKLDQKYPVKINRITGETQVLTGRGWQSAEDYNRAAEEMSAYKDEILNKINAQNEDIKNKVVEEIRSEIDEIKSEVTSTQLDSGDLYDTFREVRERNQDVDDTLSVEGFSKGDTPEKVKEIMGTPDSIYEVGPFETWGYGASTIKFKEGKVTGWDNLDGNLIID